MDWALFKKYLSFISFAAGLLAAGHFYVFGRAIRYLGLAGKKKAAVILLGFASYALQIAALTFRRHDDMAALTWAGFSAVGMLLLFGVAFAAADILSLCLRVAVKFKKVTPERRDFLKKVLGAGALAAGGAMSVSALWNSGLRRVAVKPVEVTLKKWPKSLDGFRIAQITDLHVGPIITGEWLNRIVDQVNALKADIIVITGDLIDGSADDLAKDVAALGRLRASQGVYFVTGNHEYYHGARGWLKFISGLGVRTLVNERVKISARGGSFDLVGVEDYRAARFEGHAPDLGLALKGRDEKRAAILLAHQPIAVHEAAARGIDLQLSGHTHGGQLWPFGYAVLAQQPYVSGLHRYPGSETQIYVSCGTGFWGPPMRFCAPAEITELTIRAA